MHTLTKNTLQQSNKYTHRFYSQRDLINNEIKCRESGRERKRKRGEGAGLRVCIETFLAQIIEIFLRIINLELRDGERKSDIFFRDLLSLWSRENEGTLKKRNSECQLTEFSTHSSL